MSFMAPKDDLHGNVPGTTSLGGTAQRGAIGHAGEIVRIRKYPNRRLYDTSRSRHLTHDGVIGLVAEGRTVQVTDSRSGADITNAVLLQIMIERDPQKIAALPSELVLRAMRSDTGALSRIAREALASWSSVAVDVGPEQTTVQRGGSSPHSATHSAAGGPIGSRDRSAPPAAIAQPDAVPPLPTGLPEASGRPKARAKRGDDLSQSATPDVGSA